MFFVLLPKFNYHRKENAELGERACVHRLATKKDTRLRPTPSRFKVIRHLASGDVQVPCTPYDIYAEGDAMELSRLAGWLALQEHFPSCLLNPSVYLKLTGTINQSVIKLLIQANNVLSFSKLIQLVQHVFRRNFS